MEQYEPEHLSAAQLAAMRRSLTSGRGALTRRSLIRASGMGALALGGLGTLSACGIPPAKREGDAAAASDDHSAKEKQINFSNWTEYMDVSDDEKHRPTLEAFTKRTGIKVKYTEDINDNVEFFGKIKPQLAAGQDTGRDLIIVTDWLAARIIRLGWAQKLDPVNLPHAFANLSSQFRTPTGTRAAPTPTRGRAFRPSSPTTPRRPAGARSTPSRSCSTTPPSKAGSGSSPRCVTPSA